MTCHEDTEGEGEGERLLNVDCRWRCVFSATPRLLYCRERALVPFVLADPRANLDGRGEEKISCTHRGLPVDFHTTDDVIPAPGIFFLCVRNVWKLQWSMCKSFSLMLSGKVSHFQSVCLFLQLVIRENVRLVSPFLQTSHNRGHKSLGAGRVTTVWRLTHHLGNRHIERLLDRPDS